MDLHHVVRTRAQADDARDQQVSKCGVIVITTAAVLAVDPITGDLVEVFADVGLAFGVLAVNVGQEPVKPFPP